MVWSRPWYGLDLAGLGLGLGLPGLGLGLGLGACLVLVSEGGLEQDLRLCATATLLVSKVETSK